jgi:siroheme decarboxylase
MELDSRDRDVLNAAQAGVPLASTPFSFIGQTLDISEKEVIKRLERLKREGAIRQICGSFDSRLLGYQTCLVAARADDSRLESAAAAINRHPGVTQNYQRNHEFNLWFTLALPSTTLLGFERTAAILGHQSGCSAVRTLPTLRSFVSAESTDPSVVSEIPEAPVSSDVMTAVRLLQGDFPVAPRPFDVLARGRGMTGDELLALAKELSASRRLRKIAAFPLVRRPFSASAMGVWSVPAERAEQVGVAMASHREVSQCFLRPTYSDWPYNIFTTVHGRTVDECESALKSIADETGVSEMRALFPVREFKHVRASLFAPELTAWEQDHAGYEEGVTSIA